MSQRNDGWENHRKNLLDFVKEGKKLDYVISYTQAYSPFITKGMNLVREVESGFRYSADHPEVARVRRELDKSDDEIQVDVIDFGKYVKNAANSMTIWGVDPEMAQTIARLMATDKLREQQYR